MIKKIYTYLFIILMISPNLVQAEIKVGIVKLDVLLKKYQFIKNLKIILKRI